MNLEDSTKTFKKTQEIILDRFIKLGILYSSQYHEIIYVYDRLTERNIVLKYLKKEFISNNSKKLLKEEFQKIVLFRNDNIIRAYELYENEESAFFSMEYIESNFDKNSLRIYVDSIFETFKYIHSKNIIHNDIKNNNFIFSNNLFVLIDFSFSKEITSKKEIIDENLKLVNYLIYRINNLFDIDFVSRPKKAKKYISDNAIQNMIEIYNNKRSFIK